MPLTTGQILQNRYRVVSLLGEGGMGAVYRAWDLRLERGVRAHALVFARLLCDLLLSSRKLDSIVLIGRGFAILV